MYWNRFVSCTVSDTGTTVKQTRHHRHLLSPLPNECDDDDDYSVVVVVVAKVDYDDDESYWHRHRHG